MKRNRYKIKNVFLRSRKVRRGSGENIGKPISGGAEKDDERIQAGTKESLPAEDTRSRNERGHRQRALLVVSRCAQFSRAFAYKFKL